MALIDVRPAARRSRTRLPWLDSRHSFNFGRHHDPDDGPHGLLLVSNDDRVAPSTGFGTHRHENMEIVTWVLSGELEHRDSEGNLGVLYPGLAQRMSAGTGIEHSEMNPSSTTEVHFVQMWVPPDTRDVPPSYEQRDMNDALARGGLHPVASGDGREGGVRLRQRGAVLHAGRLRDAEEVVVPDAVHLHLFVASGEARLSGVERPLQEGDAARITDGAALGLTAGERGAEVLIWAMT